MRSRLSVDACGGGGADVVDSTRVYPCMLTGCIESGYQVTCPSPRRSTTVVHRGLLKKSPPQCITPLSMNEAEDLTSRACRQSKGTQRKLQRHQQNQPCTCHHCRRREVPTTRGSQRVLRHQHNSHTTQLPLSTISAATKHLAAGLPTNKGNTARIASPAKYRATAVVDDERDHKNTA